MANRTVKDANTVKGTNPQYLIEKIIRTRIYDSRYWKEECFALSAELLVDKAMELKYIGGVYGGNIKPSPFLCLVLKMLQIQPDKDIIVEFIRNEDFKYVRCLGAFYMRITGTSLDSFKYLEPLLNDFRKIKRQKRDGTFVIDHIDEFVDNLLREERECDVILPRLQKRQIMEETEKLEPRISALDDDLDDLGESSDEEDMVVEEKVTSHRRRSPSPIRDRDRHRRSPSPRRRRSRSRSPRRRRRSRTPPRRHRSRERERPRSPHRSHKHHDEDERPKKKSKKSKKSSKDDESVEIKEANALRAKLGLKPLK
uniref:Pre-mRNA-splicing factor 38 n=1 Tax=Phallusia mammillata TaxID=59560 RepID=A0A6F9DP24_9ASCI|nr:pre-mRNA-splicing factor 38A-like [Phallusia mammillata]